MIDRSEMKMVLGDSIKELKEKIREEDQGPVFQKGEEVVIKGFLWRITGLQPKRMHLKLVGEAKKSDSESCPYCIAPTSEDDPWNPECPVHGEEAQSGEA